MNTLEKNPILEPSSLKHQAIAFDKIKNEHFLPAIEQAIKTARQNIEKIWQNGDAATFENTILSLETSSDDIDIASTVFYNLLSAETNDQMQELAKEIGPKLSEFSNDITLNEKLFARVKAVYDQKDQLDLTTEENRLLQNTFEDFSRNGALLSEEDKGKLRKIDAELAKIKPVFSENVLKATNSYKLNVSEERDVQGIPAAALEAARAEAKKHNFEGWTFTLQAPSFIAFMTYSPNRALREQMWRAMSSKCYKDEFDNSDVVLKIVKLKHERAQLLGFANHADFILKKRMAESSDKVFDFLHELLGKSMQVGKKELEELTEFAKETEGLPEFKSWDIAYFTEKLKKQKFNFDDEMLRPYFKLENVIDGVFKHAELLYELKFQETQEFPKYHPDVKVYEVFNSKDNSFVGLFYADFFPRESKRAGAWMTNFKEQGLQYGKVQRPHIGIVCNFSPSTESSPSLLNFMEVRTLFHEFGHALHGLLSQCQFKSLSGANVYWDFVELPSQILENWTMEPEGLALFAKHHQTGEVLPAELVDKIKKANQFMAGYNSVRQLSYGLLDMAWYSQNPENFDDVEKVETEATAKSRIMPKEPGAVMSTSFSHIFAGGYSAGYYSYKWAEVLDADAFELFLEKGIFNTEVSSSFRDNILARGGSEHPMTLYKKFRGREPDPKALLRRDGLL